METIIYDTKTGRIIPLEEAQALFHGQTVPRNSLGIVNKKQFLDIKDGKITNVQDLEGFASVIPQDKVVDVFTEIVERHQHDVKNGLKERTIIPREELDNIVKEFSLKQFGKYETNAGVIIDRSAEEKENRLRQEKFKKKIERRKRVIKTTKKIAIATLTTAMVAGATIGITYCEKLNEKSQEAYDTLKASHCYIKNEPEEGKSLVALYDDTELYGEPNPNYTQITQDSYDALHHELVLQGYTDEESTICLSSLIPYFACEDYTDDVSFKDKIDFVFDLDKLSLNR